MNTMQATEENFGSYVTIFDNLYTKTIGTFSQGRSLAECDAASYASRFTPTELSFTPPGWHTLLSRREPAMSDPSYEQAIIFQAQQDCAASRFADSASYDALSRSFIECVSPDRQALYRKSMEQTGGKMNAARAVFDEQRRSVLCWNADTQSWTITLTSQENARSRIFGDIYSAAWNEFSLAMETLGCPPATGTPPQSAVGIA